jgi:hypothetical protein
VFFDDFQCDAPTMPADFIGLDQKTIPFTSSARS